MGSGSDESCTRAAGTVGQVVLMVIPGIGEGTAATVEDTLATEWGQVGANETADASSAGSVSSQVAAKLSEVKEIAAAHGVPLGAFGKGYLWDNQEANLRLQTSEQLAAVQARGFTQSEITTIRDYYLAVDEASRGANPSASYRASLMQYYLSN